MKKFKSIIVYSNPPILPVISILAKKLFKTKIIFVSYDVYPEIALVTQSILKNSLIEKIMIIINNLLITNATKIIVLSKDMKEFLLSNRSKLENEKIQIIPNWYKPNDLNIKNPFVNNVNFDDFNVKKKITISYFGNLGICQDIETILKAIIELKDDFGVEFLIAGHGSKMDYLKDAIKKYNINNVIIYNFLLDEEYQNALLRSDCFIVSLENGLSGLAVPSKVYSYMSVGKPILLISDEKNDLAKELLENEAGFSIKNGDFIKLKECILELKYNLKLKEEYGKRMLKVFESKYTTELCTNKYVELFEEILGE